MTQVPFSEVFIHAAKSGTCAACGKRAHRKKKFWQTLNPFNKNAAGFPKSSGEVYEELSKASSAWMKAGVQHSKCEVQK